MSDDENSDVSYAEHFDSQLHGLGKIDWFLAEMVEMAELGFTPFVVLTVGGAHVSGKLISARQYFLDAASSFEEANTTANSTVADLVARFREHAELTTRDENDAIGQTRRYIHLASAKFHSTDGSFMPSNGVSMRFKMVAVDGFSFGEIRNF